MQYLKFGSWNDKSNPISDTDYLRLHLILSPRTFSLLVCNYFFELLVPQNTISRRENEDKNSGGWNTGF